MLGPATVAYAVWASGVRPAWKEHNFDRYFGFGWLLTLVGFLQAALLVESGANGPIMSANWFSGYLLANRLLFTVATGEFFLWRAGMGSEARSRTRVRICAALLALHVISGMVYLVRLRFVEGAFA